MSEETKQPAEEEIEQETVETEETSAEETREEKKAKKKKEKGITFTREQVEQMELAVKQLDSAKQNVFCAWDVQAKRSVDIYLTSLCEK